jgi:hypothetical protein
MNALVNSIITNIEELSAEIGQTLVDSGYHKEEITKIGSFCVATIRVVLNSIEKSTVLQDVKILQAGMLGLIIMMDTLDSNKVFEYFKKANLNDDEVEKAGFAAKALFDTLHEKIKETDSALLHKLHYFVKGTGISLLVIFNTVEKKYKEMVKEKA